MGRKNNFYFRKSKNFLFWFSIFLFVISLLVFCFFLFLRFYLILEVKEVPVSFSIGEKVGFDLNQTHLTFGVMPLGVSFSRNIQIENNYDFPIVVNLDAKGNVSDFLFFEKSFVLEKGEVKKIGISVDSSGGELGSYSGKIMVEFRRDLF